ncbi:hypothetical protein G6F57_023572 [Rhizopus arrhizus]|nr:hypothetical protein G6F57_023572 [Rhizopus arrhizus]
MARAGQRQLLPPDARRRTLLHQRHRLRQHGEPVASARPADGDGFPALLDRFVWRRRLSLRPGCDAGPRGYGL